MSNQTYTKRYDTMENCNFIKAVLMLIVVLYHSGMFWTGDWFTVISPAEKAPIIAWLVRWMSTFHIYAFTLISGYIFYYIKFEIGRYTSQSNFMINKIRRLIVPYIMVSLLWVIPISYVFYDYSAWDIVRKYVFGCSPAQLWFLLMLFGVFIIFYPLSKLSIKRPKLVTLIICLLWIIGKVFEKFIPNIFQIFTSFQFLLFFYLGFELRKKWKVLTESKSYLNIGSKFLAINLLFFISSQITTSYGIKIGGVF